MEEDNKIILLAAKVLKDYCFKKWACEDCCLYSEGECRLAGKPEFWEIENGANK